MKAGWKVGWGIALLVGAVGLSCLGKKAVDADEGEAIVRTFAFLTSVWALFVITWGLSLLGASIWGLVIGADKRLSTSKLQAVLWTYAILGALAVLLILYLMGDTQGLEILTGAHAPPENDAGQPVDAFPEAYLLLLGGPFAAAVAAKAIVSARVEDGTLNRSEGEEDADIRTRLSEAVSDDKGNVDLVDTQYLLFNLLLLGYFLALFIADPRDGLPELPDVLVALTGLGALTYVTNKAVQRAKPSLSSVSPNEVAPGAKVTLRGQNLLLPKPGVRPTQDPNSYENVTVQAAGKDLSLTGAKASGVAGVDTLEGVELPDDLRGTVGIRAITERGVPTETVDLTVLEPSIKFVSPSRVKAGDKLRVFGKHLVGDGDRSVTAEWNGREVEVLAGATDESLEVQLPGDAEIGNDPGEISLINSHGQRTEPHHVKLAT